MKKSEGKLKALNKVLNIYTFLGVTLWILALLLLLTPIAPYVWYKINPNALKSEAQSIAEPASAFTTSAEEPQEPELPPYDPTLPATNMLNIPSISVYGQINENTDAEAGLEQGIWRAYDFGTPENGVTIILASHRYGYLSWDSEFRTANSFYNLPETIIGDKIDIIWNQRIYEYEIYKTEDNTEITDYDADLILYTCKMFNTPVRVFRYANRVN